MEQNQSSQQLDTKSEYELKRQEKLREQNRAARKRMVKRGIKIAAIAIVVLAGIGGLAWHIASQPKTPESEILSQSGIHWHPHLAIYINGKQQEIPANIGLGITEESIHTHDNSGTLHLEIPGLVTKQDTTLGRFFKIWDKQFNSNCIFDFCNGPDGKVKLFVNGRENSEFENYEMKDGDKIEIRFE